MKNICKDFFFRDSEVDVVIIRMGAIVNDAIHVQV